MAYIDEDGILCYKALIYIYVITGIVERASIIGWKLN